MLIKTGEETFESSGHSFGHSSTRQLPIWEGDIPFESHKCPLKSGFSQFLKIQNIL